MEPVECVQDEVPLEQLKVPEIFVPDWEKAKKVVFYLQQGALLDE